MHGRIATTTDVAAAGETADHVIETITEELGLKQELLGRLDAACRDDVVFALNTSQFSISALGAATSRPDRVIGTHPPPVMQLIEVVRGVETSDSTPRRCSNLARALRQADGGLPQGHAGLRDVTADHRAGRGGHAHTRRGDRRRRGHQQCVLAFNHAMGPLDTIDLSGLDTVLRICTAMSEHSGDRYRAPQNIRALVQAGHHGRKTGRGFSNYGEAS